MIRAWRSLSVVAVLAAAPAIAEAQGLTRVRAASFYESYSFDAGLAFRRVSELAVPVGIDFSLGPRATLSVSSGLVALTLKDADTAQPDRTLSGLLDADARLSLNLVPGRLMLLASGAVPTGIKSVEDAEIAILGAIASDVIGFSVPTVGSGGSVGGGLVGAVPLGRFALGMGATYSYPLSYQPIVGDSREIKPGAELRGRAGLEGPLGRRTYLRLAGVYARRAKDQLGGAIQNGIGARFIGYLELSQGFGNAQLTVYGYDVYRGGPQLEATAAGQALLPKGNLLVGGARYGLALGPATRLTPRAEVRLARAAPDENSPMVRSGTSVRFGLDLRRALTPQFALVASGGGISGNVVQNGAEIGLSGYRIGLLLEVTP